MRRILPPILLAVALAGCGALVPTGAATPGASVVAPATAEQAASAQRIVYEAEAGHLALVQAALTYKRRADADPAVVAQIQKADDVLTAALLAARGAVTSPGFGRSAIDTAVSTATSALAAFGALLASKGISP